MDGVPVFAIFAVLSPTLRAHLHLMARLGFLFQDAQFQAMLQAPGKREEILSAVRRVEQKLVQTRGGPEVEA
jgi:PTS system nitrogen regulatory IIA component